MLFLISNNESIEIGHNRKKFKPKLSKLLSHRNELKSCKKKLLKFNKCQQKSEIRQACEKQNIYFHSYCLWRMKIKTNILPPYKKSHWWKSHKYLKFFSLPSRDLFTSSSMISYDSRYWNRKLSRSKELDIFRSRETLSTRNFIFNIHTECVHKEKCEW